MRYKIIIIILFLVVTLLPMHIIYAQAKKATIPPSSKTEVNTPANDANSESIKNIGKTVEKYTPEFMSKRIIWVVEKLEEFRLSTFSSKFIFYPVLLIFLFFSLRYIWRRFF